MSSHHLVHQSKEQKKYNYIEYEIDNNIQIDREVDK